ncbi:MAG: hypothetical protein ACK53L_16770, partial [Pirellulaceae bacterium]
SASGSLLSAVSTLKSLPRASLADASGWDCGVAPIVLLVRCVVVFLTAHGMASKIWDIPPDTPSPSHPPPGSRAEHSLCDRSVYLSLVYLSLLA